MAAASPCCSGMEGWGVVCAELGALLHAVSTAAATMAPASRRIHEEIIPSLLLKSARGEPLGVLAESWMVAWRRKGASAQGSAGKGIGIIPLPCLLYTSDA